jgi:hypothetical protein
VFEKHRKIKEDINNKRFPVRVTLFTDHFFYLWLSSLHADLQIAAIGKRRTMLIFAKIYHFK